MPTTAIAILNWNGAEMLRRFLPSVVRHSAGEGMEVVVIDNGSDDNSAEVLEKEFPTVRTVMLDKNYGFAGGYNKGLEHIEADYYVILNSDVEVTENWIAPVIEAMEKDTSIAACQPKILSQKSPEYFEYAGACGGFIDKYGYPFCRGRIFDTVEKDNSQYDSPLEIMWATGAALFIRSSVFRKCGGFDTRFFAHMEEIDLCWRIKNLGYSIMCIPQSKVYHVGGATLSKENPRKTYLNFRNNLLMLYKNLPQQSLCRVMAVRQILDLVAMLAFVLKGDMANAKAVMKARNDYRKMKKDMAGDRSAIQKSRTQNTVAGITDFSILVKYHLKGIKTFDKL